MYSVRTQVAQIEALLKVSEALNPCGSLSKVVTKESAT
jgi:MOSC domain-containing protein YiiM